MNDPVGIHRHTRPSTASLDKWKELGSHEQLRAFALSYLDALGDDTVSRLGYDPSQLRGEIERTPVTVPVRYVYPWKLAIRPPDLWGFRDHLRSAYLLSAQRDGWLRGCLQASKVLWERIGGGVRRLVTKR